MQSPLPSINEPIEKAYKAKIKSTLTLTSPQTGKKQLLVSLLSDTTGKTALLLDQAGLISFHTPFGEKEWINTWGLLSGSNMLLIDDGSTQSLGIYSLDGLSTPLEFNSAYNTLETIYRLEKQTISQVDDNPFHLSSKIITIMGRACYGPE